MVLSDECKICYFTCYAKLFQQNFKNWTSGNNNIDKFIQDTQSSAHSAGGDLTLESAQYARFVNWIRPLEWIPYDKFYDVKYIAENSYIANWIDGYMIDWDNKTQNWKRKGQNMSMELRILNNLEDITSEFINEV
jgi:hypothetical protein